jgi:pectin methylesterase-like acyl-CoA thioesterase
MVTPGSTTQMTATAFDTAGANAEITTSAKWTSSSDDIARVDTSGRLTCVNSGQATLTSSFSGVSATANVSCDDGKVTVAQAPFSTTFDEFVGPFANWLNVRDLGARGDGVTDDTAAIQMALNVATKSSPKRVLWIPRGSYRITSTLTVANSIGFAMIGEDPTNTGILWDGLAGGVMLSVEGSKGARFSRLTWDGRTKADTAHHYVWDGKTGYFPTGNSESDEVFVDVGYGIRVGWAGETLIERSRFTRNTAAGISTEDWNALDVWVRDSTFTDCKVGLTNLNVAGHFHVYQSLFLRSQEADMEMANTSYFSERGNTSVDSAAFFLARPIGRNAAQITLQDNVIIHPKSTPIVIGNRGPLMMIDNVFLGAPGATYPIVTANDWVTTDVLTLGNTYDRSNITSGLIGRSISVDDRQVSPTSLSLPLTDPAPFQPSVHRFVIEVQAGADTGAIQAALDQAANMRGQRPVVHLKGGYHTLTQTLVVAGGSDVQLIGDGAPYSTYLCWAGSSGGPVILLQDPVRATIKDLGVDAGNADRAFVIEVNDSPGSRLRLSNVVTNSENVHGFTLEGVDQAIIELLSSRISGSESGISVIGGATAASGAASFGRVTSVGGAAGSSSLSGVTFSVSSGGTLTVLDNWRDSGEGSPQFLNLQGSSGHLTLDGGVFFTGAPAPLNLDSFSGDVSLIGYSFDGKLTKQGDSSSLAFLALGVQSATGCDYWVDDGAPANGILSISGCHQSSTGAVPLPDVGTIRADSIRQAFSRIRGVRPLSMLPLPAGLTDFHAEDLYIKRAGTAIHLHPSSATSGLVSAYSISDGNGNELVPVISAGKEWIGLQKSTPTPAWQFHRNSDGTFVLFSAQSQKAVDSSLSLNSSRTQAQSWIIEPDGTGFFTIEANGTPFELGVDHAGNPILRKEALPSHWIIRAGRN